jgi:hypothetical protein
MTNRNKIWKRANDSSEPACIDMLRRIFPSLSYEFTVTDSGTTRALVASKRDALKKIKIGLKGITEVEAAYYLNILDQKKKTSQIKY